ncbi:LysR family transcriptional regulator [Microbulbifer sp. MLAF003]|uniref:LysR family transcriptional regulator n=1 Tax=unclassified Microbulbifer TaxID=2619833 RepID=UPI0024AD1C65|nr:LysR family transcriptional regulator [Microbulbifer sp. MLAF003]WHI49636.1 LysR family transcriptional regulator [Microbulbifer sp. MLAF003]
MDFKQVSYFLALADTLNFTRAAEQCHVSQPALTQGIKKLEEELGGNLVHREGRYIELTELGRSLRSNFEQIDHTRQLVNLTARAITAGESGELNIGIMCTIGPQALVGMLGQFRLNNPQISVVIHDVAPPALGELLLTGNLDAVFCLPQSVAHSRIRFLKLFQEPLVLACPPNHNFLSRKSISISDLANQPYVERLHCEFRQKGQVFNREQDLELDIVFRSEREDWIQCLIREGAGVSVIPLYSLIKPELDYLPMTDPPLSRTVGLATTNNSVLSPALEKFIAATSGYDWSSLEAKWSDDIVKLSAETT